MLRPAEPRVVVPPPRGSTAAFVAAALLSAVVLFAPSTPGGVQGFSGGDKVVHITVFALLAASAYRRFGLRVVVAAAVLMYAAGSELVQLVALQHRSGDWWDLLADGAGVGLAVLVLRRRPGARRRSGTAAHARR